MLIRSSEISGRRSELTLNEAIQPTGDDEHHQQVGGDGVPREPRDHPVHQGFDPSSNSSTYPLHYWGRFQRTPVDSRGMKDGW